MGDNCKKRSRKSKLVPRAYNLTDPVSSGSRAKNSLTESNPVDSVLPKIKNKINNEVSYENRTDRALRVSVEIEVEECENSSTADDIHDSKGCDQSCYKPRSFSRRPPLPPSNEDYSEMDVINDSYYEPNEPVIPSKKKYIIILPNQLDKVMNETMAMPSSIAERQIEVEIRNTWVQFMQPPEADFHETLLQEAINTWRSWSHQGKAIRQTVFKFKCVACNIGWWQLQPFREHIRIHDNLRLSLEQEGHHECNITASIGNSCDNLCKLQLEGECYRCLRTYEDHTKCMNNMYYLCEGCQEKLTTCFLLFKHEGSCYKYQKIVFENEIAHESYWLCTICGFPCLTAARYDKHYSLYHTVRSDLPVESHYQKLCSFCNGKYFINNTHLCPNKGFVTKCKYCCRRFQNKLFQYMHESYTKKNVYCQICNKFLKAQCMELEHMLKHSKKYVLMYRCTFCKEYVLFCDEKDVVKHLDAHTLKPQRWRMKFEIMIVPKSCLNENGKSNITLQSMDIYKGLARKPTHNKKKVAAVVHQHHINMEKPSSVNILRKSFTSKRHRDSGALAKQPDDDDDYDDDYNNRISGIVMSASEVLKLHSNNKSSRSLKHQNPDTDFQNLIDQIDIKEEFLPQAVMQECVNQEYETQDGDIKEQEIEIHNLVSHNVGVKKEIISDDDDVIIVQDSQIEKEENAIQQLIEQNIVVKKEVLSDEDDVIIIQDSQIRNKENAIQRFLKQKTVVQKEDKIDIKEEFIPQAVMQECVNQEYKTQDSGKEGGIKIHVFSHKDGLKKEVVSKEDDIVMLQESQPEKEENAKQQFIEQTIVVKGEVLSNEEDAIVVQESQIEDEEIEIQNMFKQTVVVKKEVPSDDEDVIFVEDSQIEQEENEIQRFLEQNLMFRKRYRSNPSSSNQVENQLEEINIKKEDQSLEQGKPLLNHRNIILRKSSQETIPQTTDKNDEKIQKLITNQHKSTQGITKQEKTSQEVSNQEKSSGEISVQEKSAYEVPNEEKSLQEITNQDNSSKLSREVSNQEKSSHEMANQENSSQEISYQERSSPKISNQEKSLQEISNHEILTDINIKEETMDYEEYEKPIEEFEDIIMKTEPEHIQQSTGSSNTYKISEHLDSILSKSDEPMDHSEQIIFKEEPLTDDSDDADIISFNDPSDPNSSFDSLDSDNKHKTNKRERKSNLSTKGNAKLYPCKKCKFLGTFREFIDHKTECPFRTKRSVKSCSSPWSQFPCTKCHENFPTISQYVSHLPKHGFLMKMCPVCFKASTSFIVFQKHLLGHVKHSFLRLQVIEESAKVRTSKLNGLYKCKHCPEKVELQDFFRHWECHIELKPAVKTKESEVNETLLEEDFNEESLLTPDEVKSLLEQITTPITRDSKRKCNLCSRKFVRRNDCKRHCIEHLVRDAYALYPKYKYLRCHYCHDGFSKPDKFKRHMRLHGELPIFTCELCDRSFSDSSNFAKHKKVHNVQILVCDICKKKFASRTGIINHLETHNTPPIPCNECKEEFYSESSYKRHMKNRHNIGNKQFHCMICRDTFPSLKMTWDHMWEVHKHRSTNADCPICKKSFRKFQDVRSHMKEEHNITDKARKLLLSNAQLRSQPAADVEEFLKKTDEVAIKEETLVIFDDSDD